MTVIKPFVWISVVLLGLLLPGAPSAMSSFTGKSPLASPWKERFRDVNELNNFAKTHPVELSGVVIENEKIDGAVLNGGQFRDTDWKSVSVNSAQLTKTVFRQGTLDRVDFSDSTLTDVVFEDVVLREVRFFRATLTNVRFVRCTFNGTNLDKLKASRIEVEHSSAINSSFSEGQLMAVFRHSKLTKGTELTDLQLPSSLTFEKSELEDVDMSRSKLSELVLEEVTSRKSGFITGTIDKVVITGGDVSFGLSETKLGHLMLQRVNNLGLSLSLAVVQTMTVSDCHGMKSLGLFHAKIDTMDFARCSIKNFRPREAVIGTLRVKDGTISDSKFEGMKAKTFILENVSLSGELNFTNAHVGELKTLNVTKQPELRLITTGSNVKF